MKATSPSLNATTGFTLGNGTGIAMSAGVASLSGSTDGVYPAIFTNVPMDTDNFYSEATLSSAPSTHQAIIIVRANSGFTQWVGAGIESGQVYIDTYTSGSGGGQVNRATFSVSPASGDIFRLAVVDNVYTLSQNGSSILTWTDSSRVVSTGPTFRLGGLGVSRLSFSNSASLKLLTISDIFTPLFSDYFNRANGVLGANWTYGNGTVDPGVVSDAAQVSDTVNGFYPVYATTQAVSNNFYVQMSIGDTSNTQNGIIVRGASGFTLFAAAVINATTTGIFTFTSATGGGAIQQATVSTSWASGDVIRFECNNNTYVVRRNGVKILTWVDSALLIPMDTLHMSGGFYVNRGAGVNSCVLDNFILDNLVAVANPVTVLQSMPRSSLR